MKWLLILISKALMWPYSLIVFPVAFAFREPVRYNWYGKKGLRKWLAFPLWITLDDEEDYGEDWWLQHNKLERNFWTAWRWSYLRNNSWNWNDYVRIPHGTEQVLSGVSDTGYSLLHHRRFKWEVLLQTHLPGGQVVEKWHGDWNTNQGDRLSEQRTWLGYAMVRYYVVKGDERYGPYWRYSSARIYPWLRLMVNVKLGYNDRGHALLDVKVARYKKFYTAHWTQPI